MHDPIAYVYEADYHCESCAEARFGRDEDGWISGTDSEGNEVGIVSPWDEWYANEVYEGKTEAALYCGTCGGLIDEVDLS
jgi:hypothetical protein